TQAQLPPFMPFIHRTDAHEIVVPSVVNVVNVGGLQYIRDETGVALETGDGEMWSPAGEVWPHHFGDVTGNNFQEAVNEGISWLASKGGGDLHFPMGEYTANGKIIVRSNVHLIGKGRPIINLLSNSNCSLFESASYLDLSGSGSSGGESAFSIKNFYLNGRRTWNTAPPENEGHVIACYGRDFLIENVYARDAARIGITCEYAVGPLSGQSPYNGRYSLLTIVSSGESGLVNRVSDSHIASINSLNNGLSDNGDGHSHIWLAQSGNCRASNLQTWTWGVNDVAPDYGIRIDTPGVKISGGMAADGKVADIAVLNDNCDISNMMTGPVRQTGAHLIVAGSRNNISINMVHRAEETPPHAVVLGVTGRQAKGNKIVVTGNVVPTASMIGYDNSAGYNDVQLIGASAASVMLDGTPQSTDRITTREWDGALTGYVGATQQRAQVVGSGTVSAADAIAIGGGVAQATRSIAEGTRAIARITGTKARANNRFSFDGDSQIITMEGRVITTNDTPTAMTYGATATIPTNSTWLVEATVLGRQTVGGSDRYAAKATGVFSRAASTSVASGTPIITDINAVSGWSIDLVPQDNSFAIMVTGPAGATVRWLADIRIVEILQ
uniref:hypothetical protein n=1 Tax=Paracoccus sp. TaxID=267 RepID=UPI00333F5F8A